MSVCPASFWLPSKVGCTNWN